MSFIILPHALMEYIFSERTIGSDGVIYKYKGENLYKNKVCLSSRFLIDILAVHVTI